jgi:hypothetical protein
MLHPTRPATPLAEEGCHGKMELEGSADHQSWPHPPQAPDLSTMGSPPSPAAIALHRRGNVWVTTPRPTIRYITGEATAPWHTAAVPRPHPRTQARVENSNERANMEDPHRH